MQENDEMDYRKNIIRMINSDTYQELKAYFSYKSIFSILGVMRSENVHSNFIAWLLNTEESHGLGTYPLQKFLEMLVIADSNADYAVTPLFPDDLVDIIISGNYEITSSEVVREKVVTGGRIDIFMDINLTTQEKEISLKVILENKVYSKEHSDQTQCYYDWAKNEFSSHSNVVFVYLTPLSMNSLQSLNEQECSCKNYIQINYQYLVEYVLEPCRKQEVSQYTATLIDNYLRNLSFPSLESENGIADKNFGGMVMAVSEKERKLLLDFWENNKPLLLATLNVLKDDDDIDEEERNTMQNTINVISKKSSKDYTQYEFMGSKYSKCRLVFTIINRYIERNPSTFADIQSVFADDLQGSSGVIRGIEDIKDRTRYFTKPQEILKSTDGIELAVCNQWGTGNIGNFIQKAKKLGFDIKEV